MDLIDIYKTFHPETTEYTSFSSAHRTFSRIDHILSHNSKIGKFEKIEIVSSIEQTEIVSSIFSDHNAMRLDID